MLFEAALLLFEAATMSNAAMLLVEPVVVLFGAATILNAAVLQVEKVVLLFDAVPAAAVESGAATV